MKKYTDIDLATTIRMHKEALDYYIQVSQDFQNGKHTRPLGVSSTNLLTAYSEVLYNISKLNKFYPGSGRNDIVARIHFEMTTIVLPRQEFNQETDFYSWDYAEGYRSPSKIESIDYIIEDNRKCHFVELANGNKNYHDNPRVHRMYKGKEKEVYLKTKLKAIVNDWKLELKRALVDSEESGLYLPLRRVTTKKEESKEEVKPPNNVISLFGL